jgi:quercetin dioxygenase-like cupin family protein
MADYTLANLQTDVENQAPSFGLSPDLEAHFARGPLRLEKSGVSLQRLAPGFRLPFGHSHGQQEEVYVVTGGSGRAKLDDEIVELRTWDALRVPGPTMRAFEAGPDGLEYVAFGSPNDGEPGSSGANDAEMEQGWWSD